MGSSSKTFAPFEIYELGEILSWKNPSSTLSEEGLTGSHTGLALLSLYKSSGINIKKC